MRYRAVIFDLFGTLNCSAEAPAVWRETAFAPFVNHTVFSYEAGAMKPDAAVYHAACSALGVEPARCLFVGDSGARELTGAMAVGMDAALIRAPEEEHVGFGETYQRAALEVDRRGHRLARRARRHCSASGRALRQAQGERREG